MISVGLTRVFILGNGIRGNSNLRGISLFSDNSNNLRTNYLGKRNVSARKDFFPFSNLLILKNEIVQSIRSIVKLINIFDERCIEKSSTVVLRTSARSNVVHMDSSIYI